MAEPVLADDRPLFFFLLDFFFREGLHKALEGLEVVEDDVVEAELSPSTDRLILTARSDTF